MRSLVFFSACLMIIAIGCRPTYVEDLTGEDFDHHIRYEDWKEVGIIDREYGTIVSKEVIGFEKDGSPALYVLTVVFSKKRRLSLEEALAGKGDFSEGILVMDTGTSKDLFSKSRPGSTYDLIYVKVVLQKKYYRPREEVRRKYEFKS